MKTVNFSGIASHKSMPCITISLNTGTAVAEPDYSTTELLRLADQARFLVQEKADVASDSPLLKKLGAVPAEVTLQQKTGSISIYLSDSVKEIVYSPWPVPHNRVQVADRFDLRPLIEIGNNNCEYYIIILYSKGIRLLHAKNDEVVSEIKDNFFPRTCDLKCGEKSGHNTTLTYAQLLDELDKELIARYNKTGKRYVVAAGEALYSHFIARARFRSLYPAHITYIRGMSHHAMASAAWAALLDKKDHERRQMIEMVRSMVQQGQALTSLPAILSAAREGRGDVLVIDWGAELTQEQEALYCEILWHVARHRGKVVMAEASELGNMGPIALKLCY